MTTESDVLKFVRKLVDELKDFEQEVTYETTLEALDLDSLDYVQTQIEIKKLFQVELNNSLFSSGEISTVGDLCRHVVNAAATGGGQLLAAVPANA
ncbi:MAG: acyl carrier protein [Telluria sp.]|nr:acyl carrier protein [Telluria sp.]